MMAPKKSTIALNIEQFIHNVEERPAIWNRNFHCNKAFLEQMWDELSAEHKLPKVVLKAKWKGLRDNFRVEYKRIPRTESGQLMIEPATFESKWIHYYALLFLIEHMRHRAPKSEKDQAYMLTQQSQDTVEKTIVEPDLTNGLISRLQDSDEEFDEIDADEFDIDDDQQETNTMVNNTIDDLSATPTTSRPSVAIEGFSPATSTAAALMVLQNNTKTPPAAHSQSRLNRSAHLFIKCEEVANTILKDVNFLGTPPHAHSASASQTSTNATDIEAAAEDLSATTSIAFLNGIAQKLRNQTPANDNNMSTSNQQDQQQQQQTVLRNSTPESGDIFRSRRMFMMDPFNTSTMRSHVPQDDDYHYLLSLHPYMHQLKGPQKLRTRTKIQKLIFKELFFNNGSSDGSQ